MSDCPSEITGDNLNRLSSRELRAVLGNVAQVAEVLAAFCENTDAGEEHIPSPWYLKARALLAQLDAQGDCPVNRNPNHAGERDHPTSPGDTPWEDLTPEVRIALIQAMIPYLVQEDLDAIYHRHSYLVEMPGSPVRKKLIYENHRRRPHPPGFHPGPIRRSPGHHLDPVRTDRPGTSINQQISLPHPEKRRLSHPGAVPLVHPPGRGRGCAGVKSHREGQ